MQFQLSHEGQPLYGRWTYVAVVIGAGLGMLVGYAPLFNGTVGVFVRPLSAEFGWGRSEGALSYSASMFGLALVSPMVGTMMDRFGIRRVIACSAVVFGAAMAAMALQKGSKTLWVLLSALVGVAGAATSSLGYLAALPQWFDRRLGLALGLAMCGVGLGTVVMPMIAQFLITTYGWRAAYATLGFGTIVLSLLACALLRERLAPAKAGTASPRTGVALAAALRSYRLWAIWLAFVLASSATLSLWSHLPSMFADRGFTAQEAARSASMVGLGLLIGRIVTGILIDHIHAPFVAAGFFIGGAAGILLLRGTGNYGAMLSAAALIGLAIGAEGDLMTYLIRSYFGLRAFGTLFGIALSGYGFGAVIGPIGLGAWFDRHGDYAVPLSVLPIVLGVAAVLVLSLGRYQYPSTRQVANEAARLDLGGEATAIDAER